MLFSHFKGNPSSVLHYNNQQLCFYSFKIKTTCGKEGYYSQHCAVKQTGALATNGSAVVGCISEIATVRK